MSTIEPMAQLKPFIMHDTLYGLLHDSTLDVDDSGKSHNDNTGEFGLILQSLSLGFRQSIKSISLTCSYKDLARIIKLLDQENLPGLELLYAKCCQRTPYHVTRDTDDLKRKDAKELESDNDMYVFKAALGSVNPNSPPTPTLALVSGKESKLAFELRTFNPDYLYSWNEVVAGLITAITGEYRNRKQISSHKQSLKDLMPSDVKPRERSSDLVFAIVSTAHLQPFAMHDALYSLLHNSVLDIDGTGLNNTNDTSDLKLVTSSISPALRHAIQRIRLTYVAEEPIRMLELLDKNNLPGLQSA
ncbi:MAG: hypothetical protein Q9181_003522 [Wetmoreana brouardii]